MSTTEEASRIPRLPGVPLLGNLPQVAREKNIFEALAVFQQKLGPIFEVELVGATPVVVCDHALTCEVCDDARFDKSFEGPLLLLREIVGDGLFTALTEEPNWKLAHRLLVPAFGHRAMKGYLPAMVDVAQQLFARWDAMGPDASVDVVADMTRMTLDTIALCAFDYRFHSMQRHDTHPFVDAMVTALAEVQARATRPALLTELMLGTRRRVERATRLMHDTVDDIIRERRAHPRPEARDLLNLMLDARDPTTGEGLSDENIRYQVLTFLIAGHETTSGTLAFALYHLLRNPAALQRAYDEVDRVLGGDIHRAPTFEQVNQLQYVSQILREALRLNPTVPVLNRRPLHDTTIGGKYALKKGQVVLVVTGLLHRDPAVWGEDAARFDPDRFSPEAEAKRPQHAFKGFGTGRRACIGSQFAMVEATLVLGTLLQRYRLRGDTAYELDIQTTLTIKPRGLNVRLDKRTDADRRLPAAEGPARARASTPDRASERAPTEAPSPAIAAHGTPLRVLFGSNMGSAEAFAEQLAEAGRRGGFAVRVAPLDEHAEALPAQGATLIVCSTYNGKAPDNAAAFCAWLDRDDHAARAFEGVRYAVFGCGNRDWSTTFQAIPRRIDERLAALGATRLIARGEADVRGDFEGAFDAWQTQLLPRLAEALGVALTTSDAAPSRVEVEVLDDRPLNPFVHSFGARSLRVLENRELQRGANDTGRSTRHIEVELPEGVRYRAGDHLGVVPRNRERTVARVAARFHLDRDVMVRLRHDGARRTHLPVGEPIAAWELLSVYVELQDVATRKQLRVMAEHTRCPHTRAEILRLADGGDGATHRAEVLDRRRSMVDLLEEFPACDLPFGVFVDLLAPLRPRYYSISSSPTADARACSITVGVQRGPARSGRGEFEGVCSCHLRDALCGGRVYAFVRDNGSAFRPPEDPATPIIMVGPGTGVAPFRGFLQERLAQQASGVKLGAALLFFGCRHPEQDDLYRDELEAMAQKDIVSVHRAFSRLDPARKVYVQDLIAAQHERVWQALEAGAIVYVCGDASRMEPDVRRAFVAIDCARRGEDRAAGERWLAELIAAGRYRTDVWAGA